MQTTANLYNATKMESGEFKNNVTWIQSNLLRMQAELNVVKVRSLANMQTSSRNVAKVDNASAWAISGQKVADQALTKATANSDAIAAMAADLSSMQASLTAMKAGSGVGLIAEHAPVIIHAVP